MLLHDKWNMLFHRESQFPKKGNYNPASHLYSMLVHATMNIDCEILIRIKTVIFVWEKCTWNVVCKMKAISARSQRVNEYVHYMYSEFVHWPYRRCAGMADSSLSNQRASLNKSLATEVSVGKGYRSAAHGYFKTH